MVYDSNSALNQSQMQVNAQYILDHFLSKGWTKNAICGMLGNMQYESTINPGVWQNYDSTNTSGGFGLVQWTPSTVYTDWASANGYVNNHMDGELARISYELANNIQWISTSSYPMTFQQFTVSTLSASELASYWMHDYERPANYTSESTRQGYATNWYNTLNGTGSTKVNDVILFYLTNVLPWGQFNNR